MTLRVHLAANVERDHFTLCGKLLLRAPPMVTHATWEYEVATCRRCREAYRRIQNQKRWIGDLGRG